MRGLIMQVHTQDSIALDLFLNDLHVGLLLSVFCVDALHDAEDHEEVRRVDALSKCRGVLATVLG